MQLKIGSYLNIVEYKFFLLLYFQNIVLYVVI